MGIAVLKGRVFTEDDRPGAPEVAVVSESMARRFWPGEDPVGKRFSFSDGGHGPWTTVVGVVGNVRYQQASGEPPPEIYSCYRQRLMAAQVSTLVLRTPLDPRLLAGPVRAAIRRFDPGQPIAEVKSMSEVLADSTAQPRLYTVLLSLFAALGLLLAAAGIFSVISWIVSRRTHEIGIRMALGAEPGRVARSMMRRALIETAAGTVVGLAGATALTGILKQQLFGIAATDPGTFAAAAVALGSVALLAAYLPARRAARLNPAIALREAG
jgi:putative ABC transport system permease protein